MATCETCAHWGAPDERERGFPVRTCQAVEHDERGVYEWDADDWRWNTEWLRPEEVAQLRRFATAPAVVIDGSGYRAALKCRATFGCVLFAAIPPSGDAVHVTSVKDENGAPE
jgi:hypothetical protein